MNQTSHYKVFASLKKKKWHRDNMQRPRQIK